MKLATMANYQKDGIIAAEYDTVTESGSAKAFINGSEVNIGGDSSYPTKQIYLKNSSAVKSFTFTPAKITGNGLVLDTDNSVNVGPSETKQANIEFTTCGFFWITCPAAYGIPIILLSSSYYEDHDPAGFEVIQLDMYIESDENTFDSTYFNVVHEARNNENSCSSAGAIAKIENAELNEHIEIYVDYD